MSSGKAKLRVLDVKRPVSTLWVHLAEVVEGELDVGDAVDLAVDVARRDAIRRNHSATHLLHWALRHVLGEHVTQKGSLVAPDRLRFDFSHFAPLSPAEKRQVESLVNARIRANVAAETQVLPIADAKKAGAIAFFGEKYGDTVRVLTMGESKEFCGGTHVSRTGDIAFFVITEETGVAQGVRRIEAVTGEGALEQLWRFEDELGAAGEALRATPFEVGARVTKLQADLRDRDKEIAALKRKLAEAPAGGRPDEAPVPVGKSQAVRRSTSVADPKIVRELADKIRDQFRGTPTIGLVVGSEGDKVLFATVSTSVETINAGSYASEVAKVLGGRGGGRPDLGQGGGTKPEKVEEAWQRVIELLKGASEG
jgi:alanyl-tRNA synthetase